MKGNLFSSYYVGNGIQGSDDYSKLLEDKAICLYNEVKELHTKFSERPDPNEDETKDDVINPILKILGFCFTREKHADKLNRPDYAIFATTDDKRDFDNSKKKEEPWEKAVTILEAKRWGRNLDGKSADRKDKDDPNAPSTQVLKYLSLVEVKTNGKMLFAILSNGRIWRLYYFKAPSRAEGYYEANFDEMFSQETPLNESLHLFKCFVLLFRKEAFLPQEWRPHNSFHQEALSEGRKWERRLSDSLKDKIFDDIFPSIAKGFLENIRSTEPQKIIDNELLKTIYDNSLTILYRLLFILFAEDRALLPVRNLRYKNYSLSKLRDDIEQNMSKSATASTYCDKLKTLFKIIDKGDKELGVPPYNGGLFDEGQHPFLQNNAIPDKFLGPSVDKLSRDNSNGNMGRINYRDLSAESVNDFGTLCVGI